MSLFSDNIRYLRESKGESQQQTAEMLEMKRGRYEPYESGKVEPPYEILIKISHYFNISIDLLLTVDVRKYPVDALVKLDNNRILLPVKVDAHGENLIEIVTHKAKAGYAAGGFADLQFISEMDHIHLPWLSKNEKYRTFPIEGDSMPPHNEQSYVIGKYVEKPSHVISGKTYIVVTKNQEMVYKRLQKKGKDAFVLHSDNNFYKPYEIKFSEIAEIWEYAGSIERGNFKPDVADLQPLEKVIRKLQEDVMEIRAKVL